MAEEHQTSTADLATLAAENRSALHQLLDQAGELEIQKPVEFVTIGLSAGGANALLVLMDTDRPEWREYKGVDVAGPIAVFSIAGGVVASLIDHDIAKTAAPILFGAGIGAGNAYASRKLYMRRPKAPPAGGWKEAV